MSSIQSDHVDQLELINMVTCRNGFTLFLPVSLKSWSDRWCNCGRSGRLHSTADLLVLSDKEEERE